VRLRLRGRSKRRRPRSRDSLWRPWRRSRRRRSRSHGSCRQQRSRSRRRWSWRRPRSWRSLSRRRCRCPPLSPARRRRWWRFRTTTFCHRAGTSGRACLHQPPSPAATSAQCWGAQRTAPAHFVDTQAKQGLWQDLRDHGASLNRALNKALRIHSGPTWRVF
jgi:hypothetical protein